MPSTDFIVPDLNLRKAINSWFGLNQVDLIGSKFLLVTKRGNELIMKFYSQTTCVNYWTLKYEFTNTINILNATKGDTTIESSDGSLKDAFEEMVDRIRSLDDQPTTPETEDKEDNKETPDEMGDPLMDKLIYLFMKWGQMANVFYRSYAKTLKLDLTNFLNSKELYSDEILDKLRNYLFMKDREIEDFRIKRIDSTTIQITRKINVSGELESSPDKIKEKLDEIMNRDGTYKIKYEIVEI